MGVGAAMVFPATLSLITQRVHRARRARPARSACGARSPASRSRSGRSSAAGCSSLRLAEHLLRDGADRRRRGRPGRPLRPDLARPARAAARPRRASSLSTAAMALLVYTIIEAPDHGWGSARTLGGFALTAVLAAAFVAWERRTEQPMLDVALFRNPRFTAASAVGHDLVLRAVRVHLPGHPVLPVPQGLRPAVDRRAPAARRVLRRRLLDPRHASSRCGSARSWSSRPACC